MKGSSTSNLEAIEYDFEYFYRFHNNITNDNYTNHWHNAVEIIMPIVNSCDVRVNSKPYNLNEFDILIIPSGELHEIISPPEIGQRIILQFNTAGLNAIRGLSDAFYVYSIHRLILADESSKLHKTIKTLLLSMLDEYATRKPYYEVSIANKIMDLTLFLARMSRDEDMEESEISYERKDKLARFQQCIDYLQQNYMEDLSLERVASAVNFSKFHFSRWFQQFAGTTFNDYLMNLRLSKAEGILLSTTKPITEVAMDAGFQSTTTFNRIFKEHNKCTPSEYRRYHRRHTDSHRHGHNNKDEKSESKREKPIKLSVAPRKAENATARVRDGVLYNPFLWADVPDPCVIRVDDCYYMTSTTMYFTPGCPIMRSYDLVNWDIINYVYDILDDSDQNSLRKGLNAYGQGSWASSLRFHKGIFYVVFASFTTNKTYIFQTRDIENGPWRRYTLDRVFHDASLFFEDDGSVFLIYKDDTICIIELTNDATAIKPGGLDKVLIENTEIGGTGGLSAEGAHFHKINNRYFLFLISWPPAETSRSGSGRRLQLCYRADSLEGPYEGKVVLDDGIVRPKDGVAQGGIVDTPDGKWYAMLFQDHGAVGRIPVLVPVKWEDDWPIFGIKGRVPLEMPLPFDNKNPLNSITVSDEFDILHTHNPLKTYTAVNDNHYHYTHLSGADCDSANVHTQKDEELITNGSFSVGIYNWGHREILELSVVNDDSIHDKPVLLVSERATTGSGPQQDISNKLVPEGIYEFEARIKYVSGPPQKDFLLSIHNDTGWESIVNVGFGSVTIGEWGEIRGTYTIPVDSDLTQTAFLFIETPYSEKPNKDTDLIDFYVELVSVKVRPEIRLTCTLPGESEPTASRLSPQWQFNHNPDNNNWTLLERQGFLRLKSSYLCHNILQARNTLTQRTFGPTCSGVIALETYGLKDGDVAGLAALQYDYGYVGVKQTNGQQYIEMINATCGDTQTALIVPLETKNKRIYIKLDFDFLNETACFYYSLDELYWHSIGNILPLSYKLEHFTGYRFALFYFATQLTGGYADFDYFRVSDNLTTNEEIKILSAKMDNISGVSGLQGTKLEITVRMEQLPDEHYTEICFAMNIPKLLTLENVVFCDENIVGEASYVYDNERLEISVSGKNVHFKNVSTDLFAILHFSVNGFIAENTTLKLRPDYLYVKGGQAAYDTHNMHCDVVLTYVETGEKGKLLGYANPLISHKLGADQCALVHDGRVYLYLSADIYEYDRHGRLISNNFRRIDGLNVISSSDFLNWTDHGKIKITGVSGITYWAVSSRKPAVVSKIIDGQEKFFLYFSNGEANIGVLTADSPLGPWSDVLGRPFIHRGIPGAQDVVWCFDPAVLIDDDGKCYLYFGGGLPSNSEEASLHPKTARVIELGDDMISTRGKAVTIDAPAFYESSGINKINGRYYFSYCTNFVGDLTGTRSDGYPMHGEIAYMIGSSPMGPFEYAGVILKNPVHTFGVGGNFHHYIFNYKDEWFITYHTQTLAKALERAKGYRSPHINRLELYGNGRIKTVTADFNGVVLPETISAYKVNHANTFAWSAGIKISENEEDLYVTHIHNDDWLAIANVDFGERGAFRFCALISSQIGGEIEVRLGNPYGEYIGSVGVGTTSSSGNWEERSCEVKAVPGVHHLFFLFKGDSENNLFNLKSWYFKPFV